MINWQIIYTNFLNGQFLNYVVRFLKMLRSHFWKNRDLLFSSSKEVMNQNQKVYRRQKSEGSTDFTTRTYIHIIIYNIDT